MKKLFALLTALALMLSLASCGGQKSDPENDAENIQNEQTDSTERGHRARGDDPGRGRSRGDGTGNG